MKSCTPQNKIRLSVWGLRRVNSCGFTMEAVRDIELGKPKDILEKTKCKYLN